LKPEAGRELDALVAEKVMGIPKELISINGPIDSPYNPGTLVREIEHYSTDISAAWEVVDRMFEKGWDLYLETFLNEEGKQQCRVSFQKIGNEEITSGPMFSEKAPHAICLAAEALTNPFILHV
jgi:hypothetical protein